MRSRPANSCIRRFSFLSTMCLLLLCRNAPAQEAMDALLDRGHPARWLVCGPFPPDVEGGIARAIAAGAMPLGRRDHLQAAAARPREGAAVETGDTLTQWTALFPGGPAVNLAPRGATAQEAIYYAAFYLEAAASAEVYFEIQSLAGVRCWINGKFIHEPRSLPFAATGVDRFTGAFASGGNLVLLEIPCAELGALAAALHISPQQLGTQLVANRPMLSGASGFEFALRIRPADRLGNLRFVSRLEATGMITAGRIEAAIILFNPTAALSPPVLVVAQPEGGTDAVSRDIEAIPPGAEARALLQVPAMLRADDGKLPVSVVLSAGDASARFRTVLDAPSLERGGRIYFVPMARAHASWEEDFDALARRALLALAQPTYGFDLGPAAFWQAAMDARPEIRPVVRNAVRHGRSASMPEYDRVDQRVVCGETILRNMLYGIESADALLERQDIRAAILGDAPGLAPQWPAIAASLGLRGMVRRSRDTDPPLLQRLALDGSPALERNMSDASGPISIEALRERARQLRAVLRPLGLNSDVLPYRSSQSPESFLENSLQNLAESLPAVRFQGDGASQFVEDTLANPQSLDALPLDARYANAEAPLEIAMQPSLKAAFARIESRLLQAEIWATCAALLGAEYPATGLDFAWRALLRCAAPDRLGRCTDETAYLDTLAALRAAADASDTVLRRAGDYIAAQADTLDGAPVDTRGVRALLLFNACAWARSAPCRVLISDWPGLGFEIRDEKQTPVPFTLARTMAGSTAGLRSYLIDLHAPEVPPLGYRTLFVLPKTGMAQLSEERGNEIENEHWRITVDAATGALVHAIEKATGTDYAARGAWSEIALQTRASRENLAFSDTPLRPAPARLRKEIAQGIQRITVESSLGSGTATRRYTLYTQSPDIYCDINLTGINWQDKALTLAFHAPEQAAAFAAGERYGAVLGRACDSPDTPQAVRSAEGWCAIAPGDRMQVGESGAIPLSTAEIVYGADPVLETAARNLLRALAARGVSASMRRADDSSQRPDPGAAVQFIIGGPDQTPAARGALRLLDPEAARMYSRRMNDGVTWLVALPRAAAEAGADYAVVFSGTRPQRSAELASTAADILAKTGLLTFSETTYTGAALPPPPARGLAVLYEGSRPAYMTQDSTLNILLAASGGGEAWENEAALHFNFVLRPFSGPWRAAGLPAAAQALARPLAGVEASLHSGARSSLFSFFAPQPEGLLLTAIKPAGHAAARREAAPLHPRDGIAIRGYALAPWSGTLRTFEPLRLATQSDGFERQGSILPLNSDGAVLNAAAHAPTTWWMILSSQYPLGDTLSLDIRPQQTSLEARWWRPSTGTPGPGAGALGVLLSGDIAPPKGRVQVYAMNNTSDAAMMGTLNLEAAPGWTLSETTLPYSLSPGEFFHAAVEYTHGEDPDAVGGLAAYAQHAGITLRDVLLARQHPLEAAIERNGAQIKLTLQNPTGIRAEGIAEIISMPDTWPELGAWPEADILPRRQPVAVAPFGTQSLLWRYSRMESTAPAVIRIHAHGTLQYLRAPQP